MYNYSIFLDTKLTFIEVILWIIFGVIFGIIFFYLSGFIRPKEDKGKIYFRIPDILLVSISLLGLLSSFFWSYILFILYYNPPVPLDGIIVSLVMIIISLFLFLATYIARYVDYMTYNPISKELEYHTFFGSKYRFLPSDITKITTGHQVTIGEATLEAASVGATGILGSQSGHSHKVIWIGNKKINFDINWSGADKFKKLVLDTLPEEIFIPEGRHPWWRR